MTWRVSRRHFSCQMMRASCAIEYAQLTTRKPVLPRTARPSCIEEAPSLFQTAHKNTLVSLVDLDLGLGRLAGEPGRWGDAGVAVGCCYRWCGQNLSRYPRRDTYGRGYAYGFTGDTHTAGDIQRDIDREREIYQEIVRSLTSCLILI